MQWALYVMMLSTLVRMCYYANEERRGVGNLAFMKRQRQLFVLSYDHARMRMRRSCCAAIKSDRFHNI